MNCCKNNNPEDKNLPTESVDQQNTHDHKRRKNIGSTATKTTFCT